MNKDNNCVECNQDTSFGSLKFINRIPFNDSYLCPDCLDETEKEFEEKRTAVLQKGSTFASDMNVSFEQVKTAFRNLVA